MKRHLPTILILIAVLGVLVGLNLVFLAQPGVEENETNGDRSTYRGTPYGTLAFYTLLKETGRPVSRFESPWTDLEDSGVGTLIVVTPKPQHQPSAEEFRALEEWVAIGGKLVVVDRQIELELEGSDDDTGLVISTEATAGDAIVPLFPSAFTRGVRELASTTYANVVRVEAERAVAHVGGPRGPVVVDVEYGLGHMTFVSESFFVQNNGIAEADNVVLALNLVEGLGPTGLIAFDEYHHGHGIAGADGGIRAYVAGTPIPWIVAQIGLIALLAAIGAGLRFARPVPLARERRTSNLEFVTSMAHIQRLADAEDLAIENIFVPFRARLCRYAGVPLKASTETVAAEAARRARVQSQPILETMKRCEAVLAGARPGGEEITRLVGELRLIEERLGLRR